jgi:uncharacterized protein (TIGR00251 family)
MIPAWLRVAGDDVVITLHIQPGAKITEVAGEHGEALKIRLNAPPVDGKANDSLIAYLADLLGLPKSRVVLESGLSSRSKRVRAVGISADLVGAKLVRGG